MTNQFHAELFYKSPAVLNKKLRFFHLSFLEISLMKHGTVLSQKPPHFLPWDFCKEASVLFLLIWLNTLFLLCGKGMYITWLILQIHRKDQKRPRFSLNKFLYRIKLFPCGCFQGQRTSATGYFWILILYKY